MLKKHTSKKLKIVFQIVFAICISLSIFSCKDEDKDANAPTITLKTGDIYTPNNDTLFMNDSIVLGIIAKGDGVNITNLTVIRENEKGETVTVLDEGVNTELLDVTKIITKGVDQVEYLTISVMDKNRKSASTKLTVYKDSASVFTNINVYESLSIGYPGNSSFGHYLDPFNGIVYNNDDVSGNEADIHIMAYYYESSGTPSPSLICPAQSDAVTNYPIIENWSTLNETKYDYHAADFNLISPEEFDAVTNDSLLMVSFNPETSNAKCKFATVGKVIPFQTINGKFGLVKVIHADLDESGYMEIAIKVQK